MAQYDEPLTSDAGVTGFNLYEPPGVQAPATPTTTAASSTGFFSDPSLKLLEDSIRKRMGQVATPLQSTLPGMQDFQSLMAQFGGGSSGGGSAAGAGDPLGAFRSFVSGFNPSGPSQGLTDYAASRNPTGIADDLQAKLTAMGPNTSLTNLQSYMAGRNPNAATGTLESFLASMNPLGDYESRLSSRVNELRGDPFDDTVLRARRSAAFEDIESARQAEQAKNTEELSARGLSNSSGVLDEANADTNDRFDKQRALAQRDLVQEEFALREQRNAQADALEATGAQMRMQSTQLAAGIVGQIATLQQQGLSMTDSLQQGVAQLGLQDRAQEQAVLTTVAQLMQQGVEMQDALQVAITTAGIQTQQQGIDLQQSLAQADVTMRGQDTALQGMLAQSDATRNASGLGALMQYLGMQTDDARYNDERAGTGVQLAALLDQLVRQGLLDVSGNLPQLR